MTEVGCPVDSECEYTGPVRSVEAHISGSQQGAHRGEVGRHYRDVLRETAESGASDAASEEAGTDREAEDWTPVVVVLGAVATGVGALFIR